MPWPRILVFLYGLFCLVLGLQSYLAPSSGNPSLVSLVAAGGVGLIVIFFGALVPKNPRVAYIGTTVLALMIAGNFAAKTFAGIMYPATVAFGVSIFVALALVAAHMMAKSKSKSLESGNP